MLPTPKQPTVAFHWGTYRARMQGSGLIALDPWEGDRLGRLNLSHAGLILRDKWIATLARRHGLPLASALGGGYGTDAAEVSARHVASILALGAQAWAK